MTTDIVVRQHYGERIEDMEENAYDENSSARLFERSRIKALAGQFIIFVLSRPRTVLVKKINLSCFFNCFVVEIYTRFSRFKLF